MAVTMAEISKLLMIVFSHGDVRKPLALMSRPRFCFFQYLFLIIHFLIQHCILSMSLYNK